MKKQIKSSEEYHLDMCDLRRYQQEYYLSQNESDRGSLKSAMEFLRGDRLPPNDIFYKAQEVIQDLRDYEGYTVSSLVKIVDLSPSILKRLSAGDFRSVGFIPAVKAIRELSHLVKEDYEPIHYNFAGGSSKRERKKKRKQKKSQKDTDC